MIIYSVPHPLEQKIEKSTPLFRSIKCPNFCPKNWYARRINSTATSSLHVAYTQQGYEAGNGREKMAVGTRVPIQAKFQERTGQAGHRNAQIQNGYLC